MDHLVMSSQFFSDAWEVLLLFLIPVGGGIPAGVVLAQKRALAWPAMVVLYFISDVILVCVFEPLMLLFLRASQKSPQFQRLREALAYPTRKTVLRYGLNPGPWTLVMITFGSDPMLGRAVAKAAGHGFLWGWAFTIMGDMLFFLVFMISTLGLNNILRDGTWAAVISTVAILGIPAMVRGLRKR
jgi:hypothetical protein